MRNVLVILILMVCGGVSGQSAFAKAEQYLKQSNYKAALPIYKDLLAEDPRNVKLLIKTGFSYGKLERFEEATHIYKRLLEIDSSNAEYHFYYGGSMGLWAKGISKFKALGMLDDIKYHLKKAADLDPELIETRWALVQLYTELPGIVGGSLSTARRYAHELKQISPVDGFLAIGYIEEYDKDYKDAEAAYKRAVQIGGSPLTYLKLANLYSEKMERDADARSTLKAAYKIHKDPQLLAELKKLNS